ncbi:DUF6970 domain-containing protein [Tenacibaculum jejuense]|uniref:DUF6970 domain-containing protein n=1 Tax=Tenacibaculum jejuense TaxID=584609 RepID=A0A238UGX8_9FLAO|nr:hypothetical protein [Tenacibaculum jejuense]SNR17768.1 Protein of unknown function precursor [Tenacibaculum jejuense]
MRRVFYSLFISLSFMSCLKDENITNFNPTNPLESLQWLKEKKENFERLMNSVKVEIIQFRYEDENVFLINDCIDCTDALTKVYNSFGDVICEFGGIAGVNTCTNFQEEAKLVGVIWRNYNQLIIDKERYDSTDTSNYTITSASVENNILTLEITSSGCSGDSWIMNLIDSEQILESFPIQRNLRLKFINEEACLAIVTREVKFNISKLRSAQYDEMILNLDQWNSPINYNY